MKQIGVILACYLLAGAALAAALLFRAAEMTRLMKVSVALCSGGILVGTCLLFGLHRARRRRAQILPEEEQADFETRSQ